MCYFESVTNVVHTNIQTPKVQMFTGWASIGNIFTADTLGPGSCRALGNAKKNPHNQLLRFGLRIRNMMPVYFSQFV